MQEEQYTRDILSFLAASVPTHPPSIYSSSCAYVRPFVCALCRNHLSTHSFIWRFVILLCVSVCLSTYSSILSIMSYVYSLIHFTQPYNHPPIHPSICLCPEVVKKIIWLVIAYDPSNLTAIKPFVLNNNRIYCSIIFANRLENTFIKRILN